MSYDNKFKIKVIEYLGKGHTQKSAAEVFGIGTTTIKTWRKLFKEGTLFDVTIRKRAPKKLAPDLLRAYVSSHPDAYLSEIASVFGCSSTAVWKMFKKLGITRKKRH